MIKPDWNIFAAKFNEKLQNNFEWLSYLLFCKEFNQPLGIFRYKNQSAIETEPINYGNEVIGFQAKYFETALSDHKTKLMDTLNKVKRDYPNITKLIIYTNEEWGQNKGKHPKGKIEIETNARNYGIIIDWRCKSFFESLFCQENEYLLKHFFLYDSSIIDTVNKLHEQTINNLFTIHTNIIFNSNIININKSNDIEKIIKSPNKATIISGPGGVGKTAIIKQIIEDNSDIAYYLFKATEFEINNIDDLFYKTNTHDFITVHEHENEKTIIIDSAEKLLDLKNQEPIKDFLTIFIKAQWRIIFTTRDAYLDDLNYLLIDIYNLSPLHIRVNILTFIELNSISQKYKFKLPSDDKLYELIRIPFYLNEYLTVYDDAQGLDYIKFKNKLWEKTIRKAKYSREQCFLQISFTRAESGQFYIKQNYNDLYIENELNKDGVLGHETAGYFITHDIYEEWALEKIIDSNFISRTSDEVFFKNIGQSLPIRRSFRNWLSDKLLYNDSDIMKFIEDSILSDKVENYWKDEIFISILLSEYSSVFFNNLTTILLRDNNAILKRLAFLLRIACKEVDYSLFNLLGLKNTDLFQMKYVLTIPKGQGWNSLIKFVYENIGTIGTENISFIIHLINEWTSKYKEGDTTRFAGLLALQYYQYSLKNRDFYIDHELKMIVIHIILNSAQELKTELENILSKIITNKLKNRKNPYCELSQEILSGGPDSIILLKTMPKLVLELADLLWTYTEEEGDTTSIFRYHHRSNVEIEKYFNLEATQYDFFPSSAFQTPIYFLLKFSFKETLDFILKFVNKSIEYYAHSGFDKSVKKVTIYFADKNIKQWASDCLWCMYRGTGSPITPDLLQSIHMALEKHLLEISKNTEINTLENILVYLIKNTKSSSITSIVTSIILAYPEKCFNVAKILFKTKEFFDLDFRRQFKEYETKTLYAISTSGLNYKKDLFSKERLQTCDEKHRKKYLESIFLEYQFKYDYESDEDLKNRKNELWAILDNYYKDLQVLKTETDDVKIWRLCLGRIDLRKFTINIKNTENGNQLEFTPSIDPELKKYSEEQIKKHERVYELIPLDLWAKLRYEGNEKSKIYKQYENQIKNILKDLKKILKNLKNVKPPSNSLLDSSHNEHYYLHYSSTPIYVCTVLIRDYYDNLSNKDKNLCKEIILEFASMPIRDNYHYQMGNGVEQGIFSLPYIIRYYPELKESLKILLLLLLLFSDHSIGGMNMKSFVDFPINAIHSLFEIYPDDMQSILYGYIILMPKFEIVKNKIYNEHVSKDAFYSVSDVEAKKRLMDENEDILNKVADNTIQVDLSNISIQSNSRYLLIILKIISKNTQDMNNKNILNKILPLFSLHMASEDKNENVFSYNTCYNFCNVFSQLILSIEKEEIKNYLKYFYENFLPTENYAKLLDQFIYAEDAQKTYDKFWIVWENFKEKIIEAANAKHSYGKYIEEVIETYLFGRTFWKETAKEWHALKEKEKLFFSYIVTKIGNHYSTLFSISKLLYGVGSNYIDYGIDWLSQMFKNNEYVSNKNINADTIFYIENYIRKYIYANREKIKKTKMIKDKVLIILKYLIEKGSVVGYILRERIL